MGNDSKIISCPHCNNRTKTEIISTGTHRITSDDDFIWVEYEWNLYFCPVCRDVILEEISECSEDMNYDHQGITFIEPKFRILYPADSTNQLPDPHKELPKELVEDYNEARSIADLSPRGAAALLRLVLQKLCKHLGAKGKKIDADIAFLVNKGLPETLQKAFDIVRVVGNEAVHPGTINLNDDRAIVNSLFTLINTIVDYLIDKPKAIDALYEKLPQDKKDAINLRNSNSR